MKQSNIRSGHSHVNVVYHYLNVFRNSSALCVRLLAGCFRMHFSCSGSTEPSLSASWLPWEWRGQPGMPAPPLQPDCCGQLPATLPGIVPPSQTCCWPLMSDCCHTGTGLLPYKERAALVCINIARDIYV